MNLQHNAQTVMHLLRKPTALYHSALDKMSPADQRYEWLKPRRRLTASCIQYKLYSFLEHIFHLQPFTP
jgi:hypothetical protein